MTVNSKNYHIPWMIYKKILKTLSSSILQCDILWLFISTSNTFLSNTIFHVFQKNIFLVNVSKNRLCSKPISSCQAQFQGKKWLSNKKLFKIYKKQFFTLFQSWIIKKNHPAVSHSHNRHNYRPNYYIQNILFFLFFYIYQLLWIFNRRLLYHIFFDTLNYLIIFNSIHKSD